MFAGGSGCPLSLGYPVGCIILCLVTLPDTQPQQLLSPEIPISKIPPIFFPSPTLLASLPGHQNCTYNMRGLAVHNIKHSNLHKTAEVRSH